LARGAQTEAVPDLFLFLLGRLPEVRAATLLCAAEMPRVQGLRAAP